MIYLLLCLFFEWVSRERREDCQYIIILVKGWWVFVKILSLKRKKIHWLVAWRMAERRPVAAGRDCALRRRQHGMAIFQMGSQSPRTSSCYICPIFPPYYPRVRQCVSVCPLPPKQQLIVNCSVSSHTLEHRFWFFFCNVTLGFLSRYYWQLRIISQQQVKLTNFLFICPYVHMYTFLHSDFHNCHSELYFHHDTFNCSFARGYRF